MRQGEVPRAWKAGASTDSPRRFVCRALPAPSCFRPRSRMTFAEAVSRSSSHPHSQECQRSERSFWRTLPQFGQICEVFLGFTKRTARPAHAALTCSISVNRPHPASEILLFNPPLAAAPLGMYCPASHYTVENDLAETCTHTLTPPVVKSLVFFSKTVARP
jgi:hypothetical protein